MSHAERKGLAAAAAAAATAAPARPAVMDEVRKDLRAQLIKRPRCLPGRRDATGRLVARVPLALAAAPHQPGEEEGLFRDAARLCGGGGGGLQQHSGRGCITCVGGTSRCS